MPYKPEANTMKKIVAINCSPRYTWNTATLVREAAKGAEAQDAATDC